MDAAVKRGTLLFVDDERRVLTSMRAMFRREYDVLLANSGQEAIDLLRDQRVDVIVSDQRMPGMTGVEFLKAVKHLAPNAMRILLTGYADLKAIEASINEGEVFRYLTKPCPSDELKEAIGLAAGIAVGDRPMAGANQPARASSEPARPTTTVVPAGVEHARPTHRELMRPQLPGSATLRPHEPTPRGNTPPRTSVPSQRTVLQPILRRATHKHSIADIHDVDLLVLTHDNAMVAALDAALDGSHRLHTARSLDEAIAVLESHPIGVMVTDTAVSEVQIATLTTTLKRHVPELVTIVASSRSDAQLLIDLINYGQIFRFLLKPLHAGQCRLSVESAVIKHRELAADPSASRRHVVAERASASDNVVGAFFGRIRRLRERFFALDGLA
jgi:DNA-binding NtrC family response regulator